MRSGEAIQQFLCSGCIKDVYLKRRIARKGGPGRCCECGRRRSKTISVEELGEILEAILSQTITRGEWHWRGFENDEDDHKEQEGDDLDYLVREALGQDFGCHNDIVAATIKAEKCWPPDGDVPFLDEDTQYVDRAKIDPELSLKWERLEAELAGRSRFFNGMAKATFDELFHDVDSLGTFDPEVGNTLFIVSTLPPGTVFYRSRSCRKETLLSEMAREPLKHVGPPPPEDAKAGRMNAEGIPVFYGATDKETCLAELRPALGERLVAIAVETTTEIRVLDFTRLNQAFKSLSYFQPDFLEQLGRLNFLRTLGETISRPVVPGHEAEYLITQIMTEYLARVHPKPFGGLLFPSAQKIGGTNVVLFSIGSATRDGASLPVAYKEGSFTVHRTVNIQYLHEVVPFAPETTAYENSTDFSSLLENAPF